MKSRGKKKEKTKKILSKERWERQMKKNVKKNTATQNLLDHFRNDFDRKEWQW